MYSDRPTSQKMKVSINHVEEGFSSGSLRIGCSASIPCAAVARRDGRRRYYCLSCSPKVTTGEISYSKVWLGTHCGIMQSYGSLLFDVPARPDRIPAKADVSRTYM